MARVLERKMWARTDGQKCDGVTQFNTPRTGSAKCLMLSATLVSSAWSSNQISSLHDGSQSFPLPHSQRSTTACRRSSLDWYCFSILFNELDQGRSTFPSFRHATPCTAVRIFFLVRGWAEIKRGGQSNVTLHYTENVSIIVNWKTEFNACMYVQSLQLKTCFLAYHLMETQDTSRTIAWIVPGDVLELNDMQLHIKFNAWASIAALGNWIQLWCIVLRIVCKQPGWSLRSREESLYSPTTIDYFWKKKKNVWRLQNKTKPSVQLI